LIDFASDLRAPTPTGAAEKAVPVRSELVERVGTLEGRLKGGLVRGLESRRTELRAAAGRLPRLEQLFQLPQQRFDRASERLGLALLANARAAQGKLDKIAARLRPAALDQDLARRREKVATASVRLKAAMERGIAKRAQELIGATRVLESLSHHSVLARGFALVQSADGALVRSAAELTTGDAVKLSFADGEAPAVIGAAEGPKRKAKPGGDQGSLF
jgi:exodeoxyribonuclease VII large subunit